MLCCAEQAIIFYSIQINKRLIIAPYHIMEFMKGRINHGYLKALLRWLGAGKLIA